MYQMIDSFMNIFKLINMKERLDLTTKEKGDSLDRKKQTLLKRLTVAICLLLKENPQLPLQFIFRGECLIEKLKKERKELADKLKHQANANEDI